MNPNRKQYLRPETLTFAQADFRKWWFCTALSVALMFYVLLSCCSNLFISKTNFSSGRQLWLLTCNVCLWVDRISLWGWWPLSEAKERQSCRLVHLWNVIAGWSHGFEEASASFVCVWLYIFAPVPLRVVFGWGSVCASAWRVECTMTSSLWLCFYILRTESKCYTPLPERLLFWCHPHSSHQPICSHTDRQCMKMHEIPGQ